MLNRILIPMTAALALAGTLSSCGDGSKPTTENQSNEDQSTSVAPANSGDANSSTQGGQDQRFGSEPQKPISKSEIKQRVSSTYDDCMSNGEAAEGVMTAMLECSEAEIDRQDARLNQAYKMVLAGLPAAQMAQLQKSERAWIKARDQGCEKAMGDEAEGTLGSIIYSECIMNETIERTIWLERYR